MTTTAAAESNAAIPAARACQRIDPSSSLGLNGRDFPAAPIRCQGSNEIERSRSHFRSDPEGLRAEIRQHRQHAAVVLVVVREAELGEDLADVLLHRAV